MITGGTDRCGDLITGGTDRCGDLITGGTDRCGDQITGRLPATITVCSRRRDCGVGQRDTVTVTYPLWLWCGTERHGDGDVSTLAVVWDRGTR